MTTTPSGNDGTPTTMITATVYGDNAYGTGAFQERLEDAGIDSRCKTQKPTAPGGLFTKDRFAIDLDDGTVTCPAGVTVEIRRRDGGMAYFGDACATARCERSAPRPPAGAPSGSVPRRGSRPRPQAPRPRRLARRLPRHPSEGRAQARPPHLPQARRTARPCAWHRQGRRRLPAPGRGDQPRPSCTPRARMDRVWMGDRVSSPARTSTRGYPSRLAPYGFSSRLRRGHSWPIWNAVP